MVDHGVRAPREIEQKRATVIGHAMDNARDVSMPSIVELRRRFFPPGPIGA